jgi:hypothetical protein
MSVIAAQIYVNAANCRVDTAWDCAVTFPGNESDQGASRMAKTSRLGQKKCPGCDKWVKGTRTRVCPKCGHEFNGKPKKAPAPEPINTVVEKPAKAADAITIAQIRAVAELITAVGGFDRCHAFLSVIRDVGGLRRMKDLLEALAAAQVVQAQA